MSTRRFWDREHTLTIEEHRALELKRPFTDPPTGGMTDGRRSNDAFCSSLFDDPSVAKAGWKAPAKPPPRTRRKVAKENTP